MGFGPFSSESSSSTSYVQDSYNRSENRTKSLSNLGNVTLTIGAGESGAVQLRELLPFVVMGLLFVLGTLLLKPPK